MRKGFTLAELLIALAILGVIATFTIPKVLQSQSDGKYKAAAKEVAATISAAYQAYRLNNSTTGGLSSDFIRPYLNYVKLDTAGTVDWEYGYPGGDPCSAATIVCLKMHTGGTLFYYSNVNFGGTATTNAVFYYYDPDGKPDASTTGPGKSILFWLYYDGSVKNWGNALPNTTTSANTYNADPTKDPPWFSWN